MKKETCKVCGARIPDFRVSPVCSAICRRAEAAGRSRIRQMYYEMFYAEKRDRLEELGARHQDADARAIFEDDHYNQPWAV